MKKIIIALAIFIPSISFASTYGSNVMLGSTMSCDSELNSSWLCTFLIDGNTSVGWSSTNSSFPHWAKTDLSTSTKDIGKISIFPRDAGGVQMSAKNWILDASNDNTNFYTITTGTLTNAEISQDYTFTPTSTAYRYYKLTISDNYSGLNYAQLWEWSAYQCLDCSAGTSTITGVVSDNLLQLLYYLLEGGVVLFVAWLFYKIFFRK